jgi:8-oxo-dGTP diphosphatase
MAGPGRWLEWETTPSEDTRGEAATAKAKQGARSGGRGKRAGAPAPRVRATRPIPRHCVLCGTALRAIRELGVARRACPRCGFIAYRNPVPACGVIVTRRGEVLLARRAHEPKLGAWGIPAGFMEYGEHPETTAVREAREETGLRVRLQGLFGVYAGRDDPRTRAVLILYHARVIGGRLEAGDDASEVDFFPLDRLPRPIAFRSHREALRDLNRWLEKERR